MTYANITSTLALFIALGGTSYAAVTVTGADVRDGSLTTRDIRDGTLTGRDLAASLRRKMAPRNKSTTRGPAGLEGPGGERGPSGERGPAGEPGPAGERGPAGANADTGPIAFSEYAYGAAGVADRPLFENFIGRDGQPGAMGVRSRQPNGNPRAGAMLYTRDYEDRWSVALDYRRADRPRLIAEAPGVPFQVQTGRGAPIVLDPSGFVVENNDGTEPARTAPAGRVEINGYLTLKALDQLPADAPVGALVLARGTVHLRTPGGWTTL